MSEETIVFVSDLHFGRRMDAFERQRRDSFFRFLQAHAGVDRLIIAGDLFQFWFDLGSTMPKGYFDILAALAALRRTGTRIDYLAGNHDWWLGGFWQRELDVTVHPGDLELVTQGRRILVQHGDGVGPGDTGYKVLKRVLRHPLTRGMARLLHPDLVLSLAHRMDRWSHQVTSQQPIDSARLRAAAQEGFARGFDAVLLGHVHTQMHEKSGQGELLVIGDWLSLHSYVTLHAGVLTPARWSDAATPVSG